MNLAMVPPPVIPTAWDPCDRRTHGNIPCGKPRYHVGQCKAAIEIVQGYQEFARHLRDKAMHMTRKELLEAVEFHLLAWRVLRAEYNAR